MVCSASAFAKASEDKSAFIDKPSKWSQGVTRTTELFYISICIYTYRIYCIYYRWCFKVWGGEHKKIGGCPYFPLFSPLLVGWRIGWCLEKVPDTFNFPGWCLEKVPDTFNFPINPCRQIVFLLLNYYEQLHMTMQTTPSFFHNLFLSAPWAALRSGPGISVLWQ